MTREQRIKALKESKKFVEAAREIEEGLRQNPDNLLLKASLADLHLRQERLTEARMIAEEILAQDPRQVQALTILGDIFLKQHAPREAVPYYRQAYSLDPRPYVNLRIARAHRELEEFRESLEELDKVLVVAPQSKPFLKEKALILNRLEKYDQALQIYERIKEIDPADRFVQKEIFRLRSRTRDDRQALQEIRTVVAMDSRKEDPQMHGLLAQKLKKAGMIREAAAEYETAAGLEPKNIYFQKQQGFCHYRLKEYDKAAQLLGEAFRKDPTDYPLRSTLEKCYGASGDWQGFLRLLEGAQRQNPYYKPLLGLIKKIRKKVSPEPDRKLEED